MYISEKFINEGYFISDKTISVDLDKFISGESNKLLILGLTGSGKTTMGRKLSRKMNIKSISTDDCPFDWANYHKGDKEDKSKILNKYMDCSESMVTNKSRIILEGVGLIETYWERPNFRSTMLKYPCIIIGTSALKSSIRASKRSKAFMLDVHFYRTNFTVFQKMLSKFKKDRLSIKDSIVKEYK